MSTAFGFSSSTFIFSETSALATSPPSSLRAASARGGRRAPSIPCGGRRVEDRSAVPVPTKPPVPPILVRVERAALMGGGALTVAGLALRFMPKFVVVLGLAGLALGIIVAVLR